MQDNERFSKLDDDMLDNISGGSDMQFNMDSDPLYQKFYNFWYNNGEPGGGITGGTSRTEFLNSFRQWVSDGVPDNVYAWYQSFRNRG
ncbi:MAG: hypothetical protein K6G22_13920 [Lachnospiraceae bacterium]|nr:hypothetical protein [Lachnospiraceae bacterium]